jgi:hypothetical protein
MDIRNFGWLDGILMARIFTDLDVDNFSLGVGAYLL